MVQNVQFKIKTSKNAKSHFFEFQGIDYNVLDLSYESNKMSFHYATDADLGVESITINISFSLDDNKISGVANIQIRKDSSILVKGHSDKWEKHKYDCSVSYRFKGSAEN
ncbi:hypothetical protein HBN50_14510 [Halobacteriovorax sp. GB3]|uniref:hypothetical protein n=1 Tax=Halobacteriovorax sp. GB3 TaxID=2719615 RepID=UPI002362BF56|nr:hypothetical protein [Halobacteriovorax sp. GB3]MDD0854321.1 hypothetical protein [Halobacteriovorax sp. GB3]